MNRDEHVKQLRQAADQNRDEATTARKKAAKLQAEADVETAHADRWEDLARGWDQIADEVQSGEFVMDGQTEQPVDDVAPTDCICDTDPENCPSKGEYVESGSDGAL
jgi:hypothetical protein